jgi:carbonic anhydrase
MQNLRRWTASLTRVLMPAGMFLMLASLSPAVAAPETPASPLARLKAGNDRFVRGVDAAPPPAAEARRAMAAEEHPFAMVLSCADSRVPPELVFGAGAGDLYVVRTLGQVPDRAVMGSLEHAAAELHVPLLVVMGHESCAVVKAAHDGAHATSAHLEHLFKAIRAGSPHSAADQKDLRAAILGNVEQVINDLLTGSPSLRAAVTGGHLQVVGAYYDVGTGVVAFSEPVGATTAATHK